MLCPRRTHTRISKPLSVHFFPYLPFHAALRTVTLRTYACPFPSSVSTSAASAASAAAAAAGTIMYIPAHPVSLVRSRLSTIYIKDVGM